MAQQTGRVSVKVNSSTLRSKEGASIQIGGVEREDFMTDAGEWVFKEKLIAAEIKCTLVHCTDSDIIALRKAKGLTVSYCTDTGVTYTVAGGAVKQIGDLKSGEVDVTFGGPPAKE